MDKTADPAAREIGIRIARRREALGMTQSALSIQADVTYQALSEIEAGKRMPKTQTLLKIAEALQVPLSALQPAGLDRYGGIQDDILRLAERLKRLPDKQRRTMLAMFSAQLDILPHDFTLT